jgi:hypothetical protein
LKKKPNQLDETLFSVGDRGGPWRRDGAPVRFQVGDLKYV